jgi:hypothetical protein
VRNIRGIYSTLFRLNAVAKPLKYIVGCTCRSKKGISEMLYARLHCCVKGRATLFV